MIFGLFACVFVKVSCFCVLFLVFTSIFLKTHAVFMLCCVKLVLFFEKHFAFYGVGVIFALFLLFYKTSIIIVDLHLFDKIYKTTI